MSRNYEVQIDIYPLPFSDEPRVSDVLVEWQMEIDNDVESYDPEHGDGWSYWGNIQLACGQSERVKHDQLRALLPDRTLITRWRYVDDQPWDEVIETAPNKPATQ